MDMNWEDLSVKEKRKKEILYHNVENTACLYILKQSKNRFFILHTHTHTHTHTHNLTQASKGQTERWLRTRIPGLVKTQTVTAWLPVHQMCPPGALAGSSRSSHNYISQHPISCHLDGVM